MITNKYNYTKLDRKTVNGKRHYCTPDGNAVASVTTILDKTKTQDTTQALENWRKRVGDEEATRISEAAADRGSSMHEYLEKYILTGTVTAPIRRECRPRDYVLSSRGFKMADVVINEGLQDLDEAWAVEAALYHSGIYAGTTDMVGVYNKNESIIDFKQTNKPKKREWIDDYFLQLTAYGQAHNNMFGTNISQGVILMCTPELQLQKFILEGDEWNKYANMWWDRVEEYYDL